MQESRTNSCISPNRSHNRFESECLSTHRFRGYLKQSEDSNRFSQNVAIETVSAAALQPRHVLVRDEVDVAIVSSPDAQLQVDASRFLCRRLIHDEFVALLPTNHSKAGRPFLVAQDFVDETYITNSALPEKYREYELFFQPNSMYPERVVQVGFTGAIIELVAAGIGTNIDTRRIMASDTQNSKLAADEKRSPRTLVCNLFPQEGN
ncbi:LysR family transcriptional regulator substrate-binding protein [Woeseia oceani]|uniref:LysR family transcriptional regulator substrate-binding protein n=1 Tax=Woeseia oceani TaxID=1548547 RepID=UPI0018D2E59D